MLKIGPYRHPKFGGIRKKPYLCTVIQKKNWSNSELKKLCKITAYDARGGEEDGGAENTPGGGTDGGGTNGGGSGNTQEGGGTSGGTGSEGSGGNTSQGGGTGSNGDNEHITL